MLPVRCRCCGAVRVYEHGEWTWRLPKPGEQWEGLATCNLCGPVLARDRQRRRDRSERATERRIAKGYWSDGLDPFR